VVYPSIDSSQQKVEADIRNLKTSLVLELNQDFSNFSEVFKALNKTRGLYLRWKELSDSSQNSVNEIEWTTTELRNSLRSIEWDLEDLEDTIAIVEKNPNRFRIDSKELQNRRQFIDCTRNEVKLMKENLSILRIADRDITARQPLLENNTPKKAISSQNNNNNQINPIGNVINSAMAARHSGAKYSKLENQIDSPSRQSPTHNFMNDTVSIQQRMLQNQDEQIDTINDAVGNLKTVSRQIGIEIDEHAM
jgi:syntaxin 6